MWRWGDDVYHTGYRLFTLVYTKAFDCYLFHYRTGSYIPKHKDPSGGKAVYRLNIELVKARRGGVFVCNKMLWKWRERIYFFRADDSYHYVTPIEEGDRWLLSFGFKVNKEDVR